jgi:phospholipase C
LINYDEWGGFFDHVAPGVAADVNPDWGLRGFRVPCLVISPRARRGHVAHNVYDHTSVLKAVEWRWNLAPLTVRDAAARNIAEVLGFTEPPDTTAPRWPVPTVLGSPCAISQYVDYGRPSGRCRGTPRPRRRDDRGWRTPGSSGP